MAKTIKDYQNAYNEAKKKGDKQGMAAAHAGAESIRADKGYSGGVDGSQHISIKKPSSGGSSSSKRPGGMSGMLAGMAGAMGNAVSGTLGGKRPSGGSSSSRPSGGSTGAVLGGGTAVKPGGVSPVKPGGIYTYKDSSGNIRQSTDRTDYAQLFDAYMKNYDETGDEEALNQAAITLGNRGLKLGESGSVDRYQELAQQLLDSKRKELANKKYEESLKQNLENFATGVKGEIVSGIDAGVQQNIANLEAMKPMVQQAGMQANQAVQQSYYDAVNPNGAGAEQRAAMGLSDSGLTESAQIAASNAYQGAVNSNAQNVQNQLAQIDLAIRNAELSGDIATAQQLQAYYETVLQAGMQAANQIANSNRWALENGQNAYQNAIQNGFAQAGLTGKYNGQLTLAGQQAMREFESMDIANKLATLNLMIQQKFGWDAAAADVYLKQMQGQGQELSNIFQKLQNQFAGRQF
ncbi:MAG: hypothetical protein KH050_05835 [Clostridiaceae bacterium]|nr:hypothetical protein [Clostridiaceae bacterium]